MKLPLEYDRLESIPPEEALGSYRPWLETLNV